MSRLIWIIVVGLLGTGSAHAEDWFSCWPKDEETNETPSSLPMKTFSVLGVELSLGSGWTRELSRVRFLASFRHTNGSLITVSRQKAEGGNNILKKLEGRGLGDPWHGPECHEQFQRWLPHLEEAQVRAYRSLIKMRRWTSDLVVVFPDKDDWIVFHVHEQWKKQRDRISPGELARIVKSIRLIAQNQLVPSKEHSR